MEGPNLYSVEKERGEKDHKETPLKQIKESSLDGYEDLKKAREAIVGNKALYEDFIQAIKDRKSRNSTGFASLENKFIALCQNLSKGDIESIVDQFNIGLNHYKANRAGVPGEESIDPVEMRDRRMTTKGIISVIDFIEDRRILHKSTPETFYGIYCEDVLDARYKIDLIECIFVEIDEQLQIDTMNLIQIKSREPEEKEKKEIVDAHKTWINSSVMDFDSFRREYTDGIPDEVTIEMLTKNKDEVELILLEIFNNKDYSPDSFIKKLNLESLTNKQKAWLFLEFGAILKNTVIQVGNEIGLSTEQTERILNEIGEVERKLKNKAKLSKDIAHIRNVNSIISIGPTIIQNISLISQSTDANKDKIFKYDYT